MAQVRGTLTPAQIRSHIEELLQLPQIARADASRRRRSMEKVAERFYNRH